MALSGVMGNTFKNGWRLQLEWSATQNLVNNTSTITSNLYLIGQYSWSSIYTSSVNSCNITIDGTNNGDTFSPSLSGNQKKLISSATKTVTHNSTGVKNFSIGAWADMKVTLSGQYIGRVTIPNQTFTLNPIPRKSTIITIPNLNIGNSLDIKINVASSDFTHTMKYYVNDTLIKDFNIVGNTVTMTTTTAQDNVAYNLSPTSTKVNTKLVLNTYSGSTLMGTDIVTGTGTITNAEPSFTNFEYKDTIYSSRTGNNQVLIAGKSSLTVDIPAYMGATGNKGASIVSYQISMGIKSVIIQCKVNYN